MATAAISSSDVIIAYPSLRDVYCSLLCNVIKFFSTLNSAVFLTYQIFSVGFEYGVILVLFVLSVVVVGEHSDGRLCR